MQGLRIIPPAVLNSPISLPHSHVVLHPSFATPLAAIRWEKIVKRVIILKINAYPLCSEKYFRNCISGQVFSTGAPHPAPATHIVSGTAPLQKGGAFLLYIIVNTVMFLLSFGEGARG